MSLHDDYARVTAFEIAFPDAEAVARLVHDVDAEASSRGVDAQLPGVFLTLGSVGDAVRKLQAPDAPAEATRELGAFLFHAVHFAREGAPLYLTDASVTRYLVEDSPDGEPRAPTPSGYLQLPQHLFWMDTPDEGAPESIDGLFWFASGAGSLHALPITGVLAEMMAFRALPLPVAPLSAAIDWAIADVRDGGRDYASTIPGHDLDHLYSMETAGEVLKLLARFFAYVDAVPGSLQSREPHEAGGTPSGPRPSRLPYTRVRLVA